jgi:hypothetical protein
MKKIFSILSLAVFVCCNVHAQTSGAVITTVPANFTAVDVVKITIDVSAVGNLRDVEPLYIWTWDPGDPAPGNGAWDNSSDGRVLVKEGPNKWSWTLTPADYYGVTPAQCTQLQFLVKAKSGNGDKKTDDIKVLVSPLVFTETEFRTFPSSVGQNEIITAYFNQNLSTVLNNQRMSPTSAEIKIFDGANAQVGDAKTVTVSSLGSKRYFLNVIPKTDFTIPDGVIINKMTVTVKGTILDTSGNPMEVSSTTFEKFFDNLQ